MTDPRYKVGVPKLNEKRAGLTQVWTPPSVVEEWRKWGNKHKIGEWLGNVRGLQLDPLRGPLVRAYALWQGVKRPIDATGDDDTVLVLISNPTRSYVWPEQARGEDPEFGLTAEWKPKDSVFGVYIDPQVACPEDCEGTIIHWEWLTPVVGSPPVPDLHDERYARRIW